MPKSSVFAAIDELDQDDLDFESSRHPCVGCAAVSPALSHEESSLLSVKYGWRLSRTPDGHGGHAYAWRCPACWQKLKQRRSL